MRGRPRLLVRVTEVVAQFAHDPRPVAEGVEVEGGDEVIVPVGSVAPGQRSPRGEPEVAHRQVLRMVVVAPVGVEYAAGSMPETVLGRVANVAQAVGGTSCDGVPRGGAGAYEERYPGVRELGAMLLEGMFCFVAPFEHHGVFGQFGHQLGVLDDDVSPVVHRAAVALDEFVDPEHVVQVDAASTLLFDGPGAPAATHIPGLVAANVELRTREVRKQL